MTKTDRSSVGDAHSQAGQTDDLAPPVGEIGRHRRGPRRTSLTARALFWNTGLNMLTYALVSASGLFVTPFVLHRVGETSFAMYALSATIGTFVAILDFGLGISAMKLIADRADEQDSSAISVLVSSVFAVYTCIGVAVASVGLTLSPWAATIFHIPISQAAEFRTCFMIGATTVGLVFPQAIFTAALNGLRDYAANNLIVLGNTILSLAGIVWLLSNGHGVVSLFVWGLVLSVTQFALKAILVGRRHNVWLRVRLVSRAVLRSVVPLAGWVLVINVGTKLILDLDIVIAGLVLGPFAIATYQVATSIAMVIRRAAEQLNVVTLTASAGLWAKRDLGRLRALFLEVNRATAVIMFPAFAITALVGPRFLTLWVGPDLGHRATAPLIVLAGAMAVISVQASSAQVLVAAGLQRIVALTTFAEAGANVLLSWVLAHFVGVIGIAIGTLFPASITTVLVFTRLSSRALGLSAMRMAAAVTPVIVQTLVALAIAHFVARHAISTTPMIQLLAVAALSYVVWVSANIFGTRRSRARYAAVFRFRSPTGITA